MTQKKDHTSLFSHEPYPHYSVVDLPRDCPRCHTKTVRWYRLCLTPADVPDRTLLSCGPCGFLVSIPTAEIDPLSRSLKHYGPDGWRETRRGDVLSGGW